MSSLSDKLYSISPIWLQNCLVSIYGLKLWHKRYSGNFNKILDELRAVRSKKKNEIEALTLTRLKRMLNYCDKKIPYYQQLFSDHNIDVKSFKSINDLAQIPLLEKETLRVHYESFLPPDYSMRKYMTQNTSGSTGTPLSLLVDRKTYQTAMALVVEHEKEHGVNRWDRRSTFAGRMVQDVDDSRVPFWRYNIAENQMIFSAYHLNDSSLPFYIERLNRFKPKEIIGYPSAIYTVARYCVDNNVRLNFTLKAVVTNSETLFDWQREVIEDVFACRAYDYYGTSEYVVFAGQCRYMNYHINPLLGMLEVVDERGHGIINEVGEIVCTTLSNHAMPLIRYKIGDMGISSDEGCKCDSPFTVLKSVEGRNDDVILTSDGKKIGRLDHIFKGVKNVKECQLVQLTIQDFKLRLVKGHGFSLDDQERIIDNLKKRVTGDIEISVEYVHKIERTSRGKFKGVISYCNQQK